MKSFYAINMKKIEDLTVDERRQMVKDLQSGAITRHQIKPGMFVEADPAEILNTLIEVETMKYHGQKVDLLPIGEARRLIEGTKLPVIAYQISREISA